jgi:hypothetical protein
MIKSRKYTSRDFRRIKTWYIARNMAPVEDLIPKTGFIVPGVAAGFLIATDTKCCILEPFIANPEATESARAEALNLIMGDLLNEAINQGFTKVFGFSTSPTLVKHSLDWGFKLIESKSMTVVKDLQ